VISKVFTGSLNGIEAKKILVEVDISSGLPGLSIVGLPDTAVTESKERVKAAIKNSGFAFPAQKVVVNLAPADLRKEGTGFDLPLCVGILMASGSLQETDFLQTACWIGEMSLEGTLRPIHGVLSITLMALQEGFKGVVVPRENMLEASLVEGIDVYAIDSLRDIPVLLLHPASFLEPINRQELINSVTQPCKTGGIDFSDIKGQQTAKRALEIAAAGGHNLLMMGPPGSGKSMLAKALPGILPPLSFQEVLEVSQIYSVAGLLTSERSQTQQSLIRSRPFRAPHHSASKAGLTGGGSYPKPGEITLAHRGVLFLDEFVEFPRHTLELMRQPLEDGIITISRASQNMTYPANFMLLAALNPCPCGYAGDTARKCTCSELQVGRYMDKLSGPLLDRIDIHLEIPRLQEAELLSQANDPSLESSGTIRNRVLTARQTQEKRFEAIPSVFCNAEMPPPQIRQFCQLDAAGQTLMTKAIQKLFLSARTYDRILRISRTIADLADAETIQSSHVSEALQYRSLSKLYRMQKSA
jgi:magnesium chelatase family protein